MNLSEQILYEDEDLVVLNKPAQVVVNRAETVQGETVQDWMDSRYMIQDLRFKNQDERKTHVFKRRSGLGHRLDKETSGVLVLAKNPESLAEVMRQFREREVKKEYLALVHGQLTPKRGFVRLPIARSSEDREKFTVDPMGKMSLTYYEVEQAFEESPWTGMGYEQGFSLVRCKPQTGRTHQIRVHLNHLSHPIVGDERYVGKKRAKADAMWCKRQFLHAHRLTMSHPRNKDSITFEATLADDLNEVLQTLTKEGE